LIEDDNLERVAIEYHKAKLPDMHIEEIAQRYELEWILTHIPKNSKILDLGYGDGINFERFLETGAVTLIEGSELLCEEAKRHVEMNESSAQHEVHHSYFETFVTKKTYDVIIASHVLEHVKDPVQLLQHLSKYLRPDGTLIGIVPNSESFHRRLGVAIGVQKRLDDLSSRDRLVGHRRVYSKRTLTEDLESGGFEITEMRGFMLKPLANSQMLHLEEKVLYGLLKISDELSPEDCANLGFICQLR
jgi:2-polyprenyl-3-methyl-5-hydroxy-6-metoxy-1,4-benzoquinol methylase